MAAPFDSQSRRNQRNPVINSDSQPEIVIFTDRQALIESPDPFEKISFHHHCRRADETQFKTFSKDISGRFAMPHLGIDSNTVAQPDFFRLTDLNYRILRHEQS